MINLGQLLKIVPNIKWYIFKLIKPFQSVKPFQLVQPELVQVEPTYVAIAIDHHKMAMIQVQVDKNFIDDVLIDGGSGVNIITKNVRIQLGMSKPNLVPYNLHMANQTTSKPLGLIRDLNIFVYGILYTITFIVINNNVLDFSYSMLFERPWLRDAKVSHNWGTNTITI